MEKGSHVDRTCSVAFPGKACHFSPVDITNIDTMLECLLPSGLKWKAIKPELLKQLCFETRNRVHQNKHTLTLYRRVVCLMEKSV